MELAYNHLLELLSCLRAPVPRGWTIQDPILCHQTLKLSKTKLSITIDRLKVMTGLGQSTRLPGRRQSFIGHDALRHSS